MILAFIIWTLMSLLFFIIGIHALKSKNPVTFFTFQESIQVKDIKAYNTAVGKLWIVCAILLEIVGLPFLFFEQNSPFFLFTIFPTIFICLGMVIVYVQIQSKYEK